MEYLSVAEVNRSIACARGQGQAPYGVAGSPASGSESSGRWSILHPQDRILAEEDQDLPFCRHIVSTIELIQMIERLVAVMLVRPEEVVVGDPESDAVIGTIEVVVAAGSTIGRLEGAVHPLHDLLERSKLGRDSILIGQTDDLSDVELEVLAVVEIELLCSERIGGVTVGDEPKPFRKFGEMLQSHAHRHDAGANTPVIRYPVTKDGSGAGIHDEPDEALDTSDFDIGLVTDEIGRSTVVVGINKGLDDKGSGLRVVGDLLMRDADAIEIVHGLSRLAKGKLQVDMEGETQRHDISVVPGEVQRGSILRKRRQIHLEEVDVELPVDVVELVPVLLERMLLIDLPEIALIVGALVVDTFVDPEAGAVLDRHQRMAAVWALVLHGLCVDAAIDEGSTADFAQVLAAAAGIVVEVLVRSTADRTGLALRDRSAAPAADRLEFFAVLMFVVGQKKSPVLLVEMDDGRELIDPELLILG